MSKKFIIVLLSFIFILVGTIGAKSIMPLYLKNASDEELLKLAPFYNLKDVTPKNIREKLDKLYEDNQVVETKEDINSENLKIKIDHADIVKTSGDNYVVLEGDVKVSLSTENNNDNKSITAEKLIIFPTKQFVTAIGNVKVESSNKKDTDKLDGKMMSFSVKNRQFFVTDGSSAIDRKNSNEKSINFYAKGENVYYDNAINAFSLDNGYLTTNKKQRYSSLRSEDITMLSGDMFLSNTFLYIGRVPVFYLPFFFYPGKTLSINPGFGFRTDLGKFVSGTYEVYGKSKQIDEIKSSSFAKLLKREGDGDERPQGMFYETQKELSPLQKWAKDTGSYLSIFSDITEYKGISLGIDTKNYLVNKNLELSLFSIVALYNQNSDKDSGKLNLNKNKLLRYAVEPTIKFKTDYVDMKLVGEQYSDPYVLKHYANRTTSFSFDSFFKAIETPSKNTKIKNDSNWRFSLEGNLYKFSDKIKTIKIKKLDFDVQQTYDKILEKYILKEIISPELEFSFDTLLYSKSIRKTKEAKKAEKIVNLKSLKEADIKVYETKTKPSKTDTFNTELGFKHDTIFKLKHTYDNKQKVKDYSLKSLNLSNFYNSFNFSDYLKFNHSISASFDQEDTNTTRKTVNKIIYTTTLSIPKIGFTYNFSDTFAIAKSSFKRTTYKDQYILDTSSFVLSTFGKESVLKHSANISKLFKVNDLSMTFGLITILPPLTISVEPSFKLGYAGFISNNSAKFENINHSFKFNNFSSKNSYNYKSLFKIGYDYKISRESSNLINSHNGSLVFYFLDKSLEIGQNVNYTQNRKFSFKSYFNTPYINTYYIANIKNNKYVPQYLNFKLVEKKTKFSLWKNRIKFDFAFTGGLDIDLQDAYNTSLEIGLKTNLSIAEFMDFSLSISSLNRGFGRYKVGGVFSYKEMFKDLARSFDFSGKGRYNTQFVLNRLNVGFVHYMYDWTLNVKYELKINDDASGDIFRGKTTIFLQWNSIPELKLDQKLE